MIISITGSITSPPARLSIIAILLYFLLARIPWSWSWGPGNNAGTEEGHEIRVETQPVNLSRNTTIATIAALSARKSQGDRDKNHRRRPGGRSWRKKIGLRKKNFGRLEEWSSDREMKKVLLWTGYGPLQEGMQLWGRVFSDIGREASLGLSDLNCSLYYLMLCMTMTDL